MTEWIKPGDLVKALYEARGPMCSARTIISDRVKVGLLTTKCDHLTVDGKAVEDTGQLVRLFASAKIEGDWDNGDLKATLPKDQRGYQFTKIQAFGVRFNRAEAESLGVTVTAADVRGSAPNNTPTSSKGGAPRASEKWDAVIVAIARLANEGRLDPNIDSSFRSQAEMRRAILDDADVAPLGVSEETIKVTVQKVFKALLPGR